MEWLTQIFQVFGILVYWAFAISCLILAIFGGEIKVQTNGLATVVKLIIDHLQRKDGRP